MNRWSFEFAKVEHVALYLVLNSGALCDEADVVYILRVPFEAFLFNERGQ